MSVTIMIIRENSICWQGRIQDLFAYGEVFLAQFVILSDESASRMNKWGGGGISTIFKI